MRKLNVNGSWMDFRDAIKNREDFNAGRISGGVGSLYGRNSVPWSTGRLPGDWARMFTARTAHIEYVICSYHTPIAWYDNEAGWVVPDEKYSVTTSKHQGRINTAISQLY